MMRMFQWLEKYETVAIQKERPQKPHPPKAEAGAKRRQPTGKAEQIAIPLRFIVTQEARPLSFQSRLRGGPISLRLFMYYYPSFSCFSGKLSTTTSLSTRT